MDKDIAGSLLHKAFRVDEPALAALPTGKDKAERKERAKLFQQADGNGNGILSLAEADNLVKRLLNVDGMGDLRPVINRSFHAARDIVPPVGNFSPHYIDRYEFRFFLLYLQHYLELWKLFAALQIGPEGLKSDSGRKLDGRFDHDKRLSFAEFQKGLPMLLAWPKLHPQRQRRGWRQTRPRFGERRWTTTKAVSCSSTNSPTGFCTARSSRTTRTTTMPSWRRPLKS